MKQLLLYITFALNLIGCTHTSENTQSENLALVKKFMLAVENKDTSTMASLLADNYEGYGPSISDSTNKEDALKNFEYNLDNLYESVRYTRYQNMALAVSPGSEAETGDWISNWAYLTIKYKGQRGTVNLWVNAVYRIENGKIVHSRTFYNEADVLRQLGYTTVKPND